MHGSPRSDETRVTGGAAPALLRRPGFSWRPCPLVGCLRDACVDRVLRAFDSSQMTGGKMRTTALHQSRRKVAAVASCVAVLAVFLAPALASRHQGNLATLPGLTELAATHGHGCQ